MKNWNTIESTRGALKQFALGVAVSAAVVFGPGVAANAQLPVTSGLACWYDAAVGVTTNGSGVIQTWNDQSGLGHHGTLASGVPVLALNQVNSKPAALFRGNSTWLNVAGTFFTKEQYIVVRSPIATWSGNGSFLGRRNTTGIFLAARPSSYNQGGGTTGFWQDWLPAAVSKDGTAVLDDRLNNVGFRLGTITNYMILKITVQDASPPVGNVAYQIGQNDDLGSSSWDLVEIIGYENALSAEDEALVGSYLAAKYDLITAYPDLTPQAKILSFGLPGLEATINQSAKTIAWTVPYGYNKASLAPEYTTSAGASGNPPSTTTVDFTSPQPYTIISSDNLITNVYTVTVTVTPVSTAKDILTFGLPFLPATITGTNILLAVPWGTDVTTLAPTYTVSPLALEDASFPSGTTRDFTTPQTYTVTAENGSTKVYNVKVTVVNGYVFNHSFEFPSIGSPNYYQYNPPDASWTFTTAGINANGGPWYSLTSPAPDGTQGGFIQGVGGSISQMIDFGADGDYRVGFAVVGRAGYGSRDLSVEIDGVPVYALTAAQIGTVWTSHTTPNFTVTAGAHTLAFVTGAGGDSDVIDNVGITYIGPASIFTFGLPGNLATIIGTDIAWTVPYSSDLANLAPTYTMSAGAKGSPASGTVANFTTPKTYTITSADSTVTNVYTVTVTKAPPRSDKDILTFGLPGNAASITGTNIVLSLPYGTDVTALAPTYTVSPGAFGSPGSGISRNFTTPKTYTVTAEDGSTKVYLVTVLVNSASGLIGHWVSGATNLADTSGFTSPGTHDGVAVGAAATLAWSTDVPSGFSGQSLDLRAGSVGVLITNTAVNDANYKPTFDEGIASKFTAAFWFKGSLAGTWVGKSGNTPIGWKTRPLSPKADFTMRNNGLGEAAASSMTSSNAVDDGNWHHMAAVFDGTASFRRIYIDGVLQAQVTGTPYAVTFTNVSHLILGANQGNVVDAAIGSFFPGLLYDVRMYNYPLSAAEVANVFSPGQIGHWVSGETNLTDTSGFTPPGTHDGVAVGASATLAWSSDVPAGFTGESLDLRAGSVGVLITNSAVNDVNYRTTFDEGISNKFTAAFWFKGPLSGTWVGKSGNTPIGWKTRPLSPKADFTMRNNGLGEVGYASSLTSSNAVDDGNWHHMAAVFDGTASFRKIYVDGVLQAQATGTPYAVTFTNVSHLLVGANQGNVVDAAIGSFFPGRLYDVRMYNYPLSAAEVASVYTPGPDILGIKGPVAGKFTISASANGAGMVVTEKTTSLVAPIVWEPVKTNTVPGGAFSITIPQGTDPQAFYRLMGQ